MKIILGPEAIAEGVLNFAPETLAKFLNHLVFHEDGQAFIRMRNKIKDTGFKYHISNGFVADALKELQQEIEHCKRRRNPAME